MEKVKYKVSVKGTDVFGLTFLDNVVSLANLGAVIDDDHLISNKWPHYCVMTLETNKDIDKVVVSDITKGVEVLEDASVPKDAYLSQEQLSELSWYELRVKAKKHFGIIGRDRKVLEEEYLSLVEAARNGGSED